MFVVIIPPTDWINNESPSVSSKSLYNPNPPFAITEPLVRVIFPPFPPVKLPFSITELKEVPFAVEMEAAFPPFANASALFTVYKTACPPWPPLNNPFLMVRGPTIPSPPFEVIDVVEVLSDEEIKTFVPPLPAVYVPFCIVTCNPVLSIERPPSIDIELLPAWWEKSEDPWPAKNIPEILPPDAAPDNADPPLPI